MDNLRQLGAVAVVLGWAALYVFLGVFAAVGAWGTASLARGTARQVRTRRALMTAPSSAHPASRALAARKSWVDEQGDHYTTAPVDEAMPPCTCPPGWHTGTAPVSTRLADRRANRVADAGLFAFLADDMPDNHKVADMFDLYCAEAEDRS